VQFTTGFAKLSSDHKGRRAAPDGALAEDFFDIQRESTSSTRSPLIKDAGEIKSVRRRPDSDTIRGQYFC
jgi:hypothetical protein